MGSSMEKVFLPLFVVVCFICTHHFTDGKTSVIIKKFVTPRHIDVSARDGVYARTYVYGDPISRYSEPVARSPRDVFKLRGRRENFPKTYASRYKTWSPNKDGLRLREPPAIKVKPYGKRRRPPHPSLENEIFYVRRPERPQKNRFGSLQRPTPPAESLDDFDSEDYFPEETKRNEAQYAYRDGHRRPTKKRRNPLDRKKKPKKPIPYAKPVYDDYEEDEDERRIVFGRDRPEAPIHKPKREPTISYSTFIKHPSSSPIDVDYDYAEEDDSRRVPHRKKKRRIKKKTNKHREESMDYRGDKFTSGAQEMHSFPYAYAVDEDYDSSTRSKLKLSKYKAEQQQPIYGEGHVSNQYAATNLFRTPTREEYTGQKQNLQSFGAVSNPQIQSIASPSPVYGPSTYETDAFRPSYESIPYKSSYDNNNIYSGTTFSQPNIIHYNKITKPSQEYSIQQPTVYGYGNANVGAYSSSSYSSGGYINNPVTSPFEGFSSTAYQKYQKTYQAEPTRQSTAYYSPSVSYQKDVVTSYKTSTAYDNTDTYKDFNSNASNQKKYGTYSSKYSERIVPSVQISERPDDESDFLKKHQNLYNNGITGVPIQGDGYMNKEKKQDYDIGYGEFQFDENP